jgi:hypothetical protein
VQIDFDYIHTILLTLMTVNSTPENLDRYTIISMAISNANAQQDEYKKLHTTPKTKKPAAKSVNPAITAEALAEAKGN